MSKINAFYVRDLTNPQSKRILVASIHVDPGDPFLLKLDGVDPISSAVIRDLPARVLQLLREEFGYHGSIHFEEAK